MSLDKKIKFKVNGIHCGGCASKIKNSMIALDSESITDVNVESGEVVIEFNSLLNQVSVLKENIVKLGFQVESMSFEQK